MFSGLLTELQQNSGKECLLRTLHKSSGTETRACQRSIYKILNLLLKFIISLEGPSQTQRINAELVPVRLNRLPQDYGFKVGSRCSNRGQPMSLYIFSQSSLMKAVSFFIMGRLTAFSYQKYIEKIYMSQHQFRFVQYSFSMYALCSFLFFLSSEFSCFRSWSFQLVSWFIPLTIKFELQIRILYFYFKPHFPIFFSWDFNYCHFIYFIFTNEQFMNYLKLIHIMISFLIKSPFCFRMFSQVVKSTKYISFKDGPPSAMHVSERQIKCGQDQLLIKVKAIGLNRAQCLQRAGKYAAQKQVQKYLGLQASGQVYDPNQPQKKLFDGMALLSGGSYGQWVTVPKQHIMKIPTNLSFIQGAAIPQAWLTAFQIIRFADLKQGQSLVIYAGASGVGTAAIQICKYLKFKAFAVCSTPQKGKICKQVGATGVAYYKDNQKWEEDLIKQNDGKHFEAVLDCVGSSNVNQTLKLIKVDGKWVLYGLLSGGKTELNLASLLGKRINLISTTLKSRSKEYKSQLIEDFKNRVVPGFEQGKLKPIIHCTIDCDWKSEKAFVEGHEIMQNNQNAGKIIINYL